jgi:hypothetical protein
MRVIHRFVILFLLSPLLTATAQQRAAVPGRPQTPTGVQRVPNGSPAQPSAAPASQAGSSPANASAKTKDEKLAAERVAELFRRTRAAQKLTALKRINTTDTTYLCASAWKKPYPAYEELHDWLALANYVTREPGTPAPELAKLAAYQDSRDGVAKRFSVEVCQTGTPGQYRVVAAIWSSAWQTNLGRIPVCNDDFDLWPFCAM